MIGILYALCVSMLGMPGDRILTECPSWSGRSILLLRMAA